MELEFRATKKFEKDMDDLPSRDAKRIVEQLNRNCSMLQQDQTAFYRTVYRPEIPQLKCGMESTLYSMRIGRDLRVLLTVDEDPLFDQLIFTLLRVVRHKDLEKAFRSIAESLYQSELSGFSGRGRHGAD